MFAIPVFTVVEIQKAGAPVSRWKPHVTRRELRFEHHEHAGSGGMFTFREGGWLIRVERSKLTANSSQTD